METFPPDFSDLLDERGRELMAHAASQFATGERRLLTVTGEVMTRATAHECVRLLDANLYKHLRPIVQRIPANSISSMKKNYSERLPKVVSMKTCFLQSSRYRGYRPAERIGLIAMLQSDSLRRLAAAMTGLEVTGGSAQAICYEHGDYAGPHNDHHPESRRLRRGYVDLHIMFGNDAVSHQWLVYEEGGHLRRIVDVNQPSAIAAYRLPFWHYTTPLTGKPGREAEARRWLLLMSYYIVRGRTKTSNAEIV